MQCVQGLQEGKAERCITCHAHTRARMHAHTDAYTHTCTHTHTHTHMHTHTRISHSYSNLLCIIKHDLGRLKSAVESLGTHFSTSSCFYTTKILMSIANKNVYVHQSNINIKKVTYVCAPRWLSKVIFHMHHS